MKISLLITAITALTFVGCGEVDTLLGLEEETGNQVTRYMEDKIESDNSLLLDIYITDKLSGEPKYTDQEASSIYLYSNPNDCTVYTYELLLSVYLPKKVSNNCSWDISDTDVNLHYTLDDGAEKDLTLNIGDWYSEDAKSFKTTIEDTLFIATVK